MTEEKNFFEEMSEMIEQVKAQPKPGEELDYEQAIKQVEGALDTLNKELDEVCEQTGMSMEELEAYTSDPKNFSKEEWDSIQKIQAELAGMQAPVSQEAVDAITGTKKPKKKSKRKGWVRG